jgi:hypothetical protein
MSHFFEAKSDIAAIESAVRRFHEEKLRYPKSIEDLTRSDPTDGTRSRYLIRLPKNPWGNPYIYQFLGDSDGERFKISTTPDIQTQQRTGQKELTNNTDWGKLLEK